MKILTKGLSNKNQLEKLYICLVKSVNMPNSLNWHGHISILEFSYIMPSTEVPDVECTPHRTAITLFREAIRLFDGNEKNSTFS